MIGRFVVTVALVAVLVECGENVSTTTTTTTTTTTSATTTTTTNTAKNAVKAIGPVVRYDVSGNDTNGSTALKEIVVFDGHDTHAVNITDLQAPAVADDKITKSSNNSGNTVAGANVKIAGNVNNPTAEGTVLRTNITNTTDTNPTTATATTTGSITTETTNVSPTNNDAKVVHIVPNKYCYCDLIYGDCDVNCCCDTDCTNHDLKTFTFCSDRVTSSVIKPESILFDSSLFYVVIDNVPSDYFYPERNAIESESQIAMSVRNRDLFTWQDARTGRPSRAAESTVYNSYDLTYKSLRWMYTVVSDGNASEIKTLSLKNSAFNSLCSVEQPVEYLTPKQTHCQTFVSNLTYFCNNDSSLSFTRYYGEKGIFKVVQPVDNSSSSVHKTEKFGLVTIRATAHHRCVGTNGSSYDCRVRNSAGDTGHHPVYSGGVCRRAVVAVEYRVTHNGTRGVRRVDVHFRHRDVEDAAGRPLYVDQRFGARFAWTADPAAAAAEPYERSGKPGYATGVPVLVSAAAAAGKRAERRGGGGGPKPMDLPGPNGHGTCDAAGGFRTRVNFRENVDVRCRVRVWQRRRRRSDKPEETGSAAELCRGIQNETVSALGSYDGMSVASLGDPDVATWIPVVVVRPPAPASPPHSSPSLDVTSCAAITDGVRVQVFYSYAGAFDRPQATVLGVSVNYTASAVTVNGGIAETTRGNGDDDDDDDDDTAVEMVAEVPVRATVVFVDLTRPPVRTFAEPPTYEFKLPEDFYYPFWSSNDDGVSSSAAVASDSHSHVQSSVALLVNLAFVLIARARILMI